MWLYQYKAEYRLDYQHVNALECNIQWEIQLRGMGAAALLICSTALLAAARLARREMGTDTSDCAWMSTYFGCRSRNGWNFDSSR